MISAMAITPPPTFYVPFGGSFADIAGGVVPTVTGAPSSTDATAPTGSGASGFTGADYVDYGAILPLNTSTPYTICLWLRAPVSGWSDWMAAFGHGEGGWQIRIGGSANNIAWTGHGSDDAVGLASSKDNVWRHFAFVWTGTSKVVYIDGVLAQTISGRSSNNGTGGNLRIGNSPNFGGRNWPGGIDDVAVWASTNLTAAQIAALAFKPPSKIFTTGNQAPGGVGLNATVLNGNRLVSDGWNPADGTVNIIHDLLDMYYIERVNWVFYYPDTRTYTNVALYASPDGVNWTTIRSPANYTVTAAGGGAGLDIPVLGAYRYFKFHGEGSSVNASNWWVECEIWSKSPMTGGGYG